MTDLETLIREAARQRRLTALTLWPSGGGWSGNAKNDLGGWNCVSGSDPVAVLREALSGPFATPSVPGGTLPGRKAADPAPAKGVFD